MSVSLADWLEPHGVGLEIRAACYEATTLLEAVSVPCLPGQLETAVQIGATHWNARLETEIVPDRPDAVEVRVVFRLREGTARETSVGIGLRVQNWSADNYVLLPAAVYNGNRFESRDAPYPPVLTDPADRGADCPTIISDVSRLNLHDGVSRLQQLTRDPATPAMGWFAPHQSVGWWLLTEQATRLGDSGLEIEESDDRGKAVLRLSAPGIREEAVHRMWKPYTDRGANFAAGEEVTLRFRLYRFACADIPAFIERFVMIRKDITGIVTLLPGLPFSAAWDIQEQKTNRDNWNETHGYYACGPQNSDSTHWQLGWVGGLLNTYPMLTDGSEISRQRVRRTFDYAFKTQTEAGLMWGVAVGDRLIGDAFGKITPDEWHLVRRSGDALYFLLRQFGVIEITEKQNTVGETLPAHWREGTRRLADALVRVWERYGQFGQFLNVLTGAMEVGNSTSGAMIPAGLALAAQWFEEPNYLRVAEAAASDYYERFVRRGYTTGGPGEALQCPDSESVYGLLESFVTLYETTGDAKWLPMASDTANLCATWCVSYDFRFPPESLFGRMEMKTAGAVYANVQNKHGAPGICTLSGVSLLKLWRATGNAFFLELLRETAHNMTQYLSRADRPVGQMPPGWMTERVNLSDWAEGVGEIFEGSCWCEVSLMLTWAEIPSLYLQTDTGFNIAFDHVSVGEMERREDGIMLTLTNPTQFPMRLKTFAETSTQTREPLGQNFLLDCPIVALLPGETCQVHFADGQATKQKENAVKS